MKMFLIILWSLVATTDCYSQALNRKGENILVADFSDTIFKSRVNFSRCNFQDKANFGSASFDSTANFSKTNFYYKADFSSAVFDSDVYFVKTNFSSITDFYDTKFKHKAYFYITTFDSTVSFKNAKFNSLAYFIDTKFHSEVKFENANFYSLAEFQKVTFNKPANFKYIIFDSVASFIDSKFLSNADFSGTRFHNSVDFEKAIFMKTSSFVYTKFLREAGFQNVIFDHETNFIKSTFESFSSFNNASFNKESSFELVNFKQPTSFNKAKINSYFRFNKAEFRGKVDFSQIYFGKDGFLDLSNVRFYRDNECFINLKDTDLSKVKIRYGGFRIDTSNFDTAELEAHYLDLRSRLIELKYIEDAEILDKEYRKWVYLYKDPENKHWIVNAFHKYWWGYNYDKYLIVYNTLYIFIFFFLINLLLMPKMCRDIYIVEMVKQDIDNASNEPLLKRILRRIFQTVFYTGIIFFGVYFKTENFVVKNRSLFGKQFPLIIYFFLMYGSGLICLGYLANFVLSK